MRYAFVLLLAVFLTGCGGDSESTADPSLDDAAAEYQQKVKKSFSDSIVNSLAREWDVEEDQVRCVLEELRPYQIEQVASDPAVQTVFKDCGIDPAVVK